MFTLPITLTLGFNMFLVSSFGKPCLLDIQCSVVTKGAICESTEKNKNDTDVTETSTVAEKKVCTCDEKDYYKFGRCFNKRCKMNNLC